MADQTRQGMINPEKPPVTAKAMPHDRASDPQSQWREFPPGAGRLRPTAAIAAWLAGILADLGAGDDAACRPLHPARAGPARLRRQRQAGRPLWPRPARE